VAEGEGDTEVGDRGKEEDPAGGLVLVTPRFTTLALLPLQLRIGARVVDANGEWEVIGGPWSMAAGETVHVFTQGPSDPGTKRELAWAAHEKITVRRKA